MKMISFDFSEKEKGGHLSMSAFRNPNAIGYSFTSSFGSVQSFL
jgi:hypothetical protein